MYSEKVELRAAANWPGVKAGSRESLMEQLQGSLSLFFLCLLMLPSTNFLPPHRFPPTICDVTCSQTASVAESGCGSAGQPLPLPLPSTPSLLLLFLLSLPLLPTHRPSVYQVSFLSLWSVCHVMHHRREFPSETVHILTAHSDEVWFLVFSHDGSRLASGAKDGEIILWDMKVCVFH